MLVNVAMVIVGLLALIWGADRFVIGAGAMARNLGVPPMHNGLTVVGIAPSARSGHERTTRPRHR